MGHVTGSLSVTLGNLWVLCKSFAPTYVSVSGIPETCWGVSP